MVVAFGGARVTKAEQLEKKRFAASRHHHLPLFPCPPGLRTRFGSTASGRPSITESVLRLDFASLFWKTATASPFASHKSDGCVRLLFRGGLCSAVCCTPAPSHPLSHAPQHSPAPPCSQRHGPVTHLQPACQHLLHNPLKPLLHTNPPAARQAPLLPPLPVRVFLRGTVLGAFHIRIYAFLLHFGRSG